MSDGPIELDELDRLANEAFPGLVVRKDLLRRMRSAFGGLSTAQGVLFTAAA